MHAACHLAFVRFVMLALKSRRGVRMVLLGAPVTGRAGADQVVDQNGVGSGR